MSADPSAEGWRWTLIQTRRCPQCGQHPAARPPATLARLGVTAASSWRRFLGEADERDLRVSPGPQVWTPLQYAAHSRDMLRVFGKRIVMALSEDDPAVPWFDPGPEGWELYNRLDPAAIAADIEAQADRLAAILAGCSDHDWSRTARRDGVDRFTVAGLACFAVHEAHHHLLDADGTL